MKKLGLPYFAELIEQVKQRYGLSETFILDDALRKKIRSEAIILSVSHWHARESFWYEKILPDINSRIVFICGHEHVARFNNLLKQSGHESVILDPYWHKEIFKDYKNINLD